MYPAETARLTGHEGGSGLLLEELGEVANPLYSESGETYVFFADVLGTNKAEIAVSNLEGSVVLDRNFEKKRVIVPEHRGVNSPFLIDFDRDRKYDFPATGTEEGTSFLYVYSMLGETVDRYNLVQAAHNYDRIVPHGVRDGRMYCSALPGNYQNPRGILCFDIDSLDLIWDFAIPAVPEGLLFSPEGAAKERILLSHTTSDQGLQNKIGRQKEHLSGGDAVIRYYVTDREGRTIRYNPILIPAIESRTIPEPVSGSALFVDFANRNGDGEVITVHISRNDDSGGPVSFQLLKLGQETGFVSDSSIRFNEKFQNIRLIRHNAGLRIFLLSRNGGDTIIRELNKDCTVAREIRLDPKIRIESIDGFIISADPYNTLFLICRTRNELIILTERFQIAGRIPAPGIRRAGVIDTDGDAPLIVTAGKSIRGYRVSSPR